MYWTGTAGTAHLGSVTDVLQRRLARLPAGAYAVRMGRRADADPMAMRRRPIEASRCTVTEVVPLNPALIARSLRRLLDAPRFPKALPQVVTDVSGWRQNCEDAVRRVRDVLDAAGRKDWEGLGRACVIVGRVPASSRGAWERSVEHAAARAGVKHFRSLLGGLGDAAGDVRAAAADVLIFAPDRLGSFLGKAPVMVEMARLLDEAPRVRWRTAAAMQRRAIESAIGELDGAVELSGYVTDPGRAREREMARFQNAYRSAIVGLLTTHFYGPGREVGDAESAELDLIDAIDLRPLAFLAYLLEAPHLRRVLVGEPVAKAMKERPAAVRWSSRDGASRLMCTATGRALSVREMGAIAAEASLKRGEAACAKRVSSRAAVLSMGAVNAIVADEAGVRWVEACCRLWPLSAGGGAHVVAALSGLEAAANAGDGDEAERSAASAALAEHADALLRGGIAQLHPRGARHSRNTVDRTLASAINAVCFAAAGGMEAGALKRRVSRGQFAALWRILERGQGELPLFSAAMDRWERRLLAGTKGDRRGELADAHLEGPRSELWAGGYVLLGEALVDRVLDALDDRHCTRRWAAYCIRCLCAFVSGDDRMFTWFNGDSADRRRARVLAAAAPAALIEWRKGRPVDERGGGAVIILCFRCLNVAREAEAEAATGGPSPTAFDAGRFYRELCTATFALVARSAKHADAEFFGYLDGRSLQVLVALARGTADRAAVIGFGVADESYREIDQVREAWRFLGTIDPLQEIVSGLVSHEGSTARVLRMLARLGLALRLRRHSVLRDQLMPLANAAPEVDEANGDAVVPLELRGALAELRRWRGDETVPNGISEVLRRPAALRSELATLRATANRTAAASRRVEHLERLLGDPAKLAAWVRRDLLKLVPAALDEARLARLEAVARHGVESHFAEVIGAATPAALDARSERNWDNALRLYVTVDGNKSLLKRLLARAAVGDRTWFLAQARNVEFAAGLRKLGVDPDKWLASMTRTVEVDDIGPIRVEVETDPLHVLQMGNYFETCLSVGDINAFSTVANAIEVNKRVIYVYDGRGVVIGRKLVALNRKGELVGFNTYGALPQKAGDRGSTDSRDRLKAIVDEFCVDLARRCGARLHPNSRAPNYEDGADLALFAKWYNDGPEAFGAKWVARAGKPVKRSRR